MENKEALNRQLSEIIQSMISEGLINNQFAFVKSLKVPGDSSHLVDIITKFCTDTPNTLNELTEALNKLIVDYNFVKVNLYKVKGSALSLGARRVALAFCDFEQALYNESKEECVLALNGVKYEYIILEEKLRVVLQLERRILRSST